MLVRIAEKISKVMHGVEGEGHAVTTTKILWTR